MDKVSVLGATCSFFKLQLKASTSTEPCVFVRKQVWKQRWGYCRVSAQEGWRRNEQNKSACVVEREVLLWGGAECGPCGAAAAAQRRILRGTRMVATQKQRRLPVSEREVSSGGLPHIQEYLIVCTSYHFNHLSPSLVTITLFSVSRRTGWFCSLSGILR